LYAGIAAIIRVKCGTPLFSDDNGSKFLVMELLLIFKDGIASYFKEKNQKIPNSNLFVKILESNNYTPDTFSNFYPLK
jgi:hypothetical protein